MAVFSAGLLFSLAVGNATAQSFSSAVKYDTGSNPQGGAVGDFNGDGYADVAIACTYTNNVTVFINKGDGTFQNGVSYPTDTWSLGVAVGDLNKDGKLDLVVENTNGGSNSTGSISVLLGNGDGTFQAAVNYDVLGFGFVKIANLNNDMNPDVVVASKNGQAAMVLLGNGNGTLQPAVAYDAGIHANDIDVADFNGDGKLDLALASYDDSATSILMGNGDGSFVHTLTISTPGNSIGIVATDLNGDNKPDLVVSSPNGGVLSVGSGVRVILGNGDGTFQPPVFYATASQGPEFSAVADLNGDGKKDIASCNIDAKTLTILRGNGDGTFTLAQTISIRANTFTPVAADLNKDGKPDLFTINNAFNLVDVRLNSPAPKSVAINVVAGQSSNVLAASFIDYNTSKTACNYTATINWGDGTTTSAGAITPNGVGGFNVTGSHTYSSGGIFLVNVQVADDAGNFATVTSTATVGPANGKLLAVGSGSGQSTTVNNAFSTQLSTTYTESGLPVSGVLITFTAPVCGASGTFAGSGTTTESVVTDGSGVATASMFTANSIGGTYAVQAMVSSGSPAATFTLTNTKLDQTINFAALLDKTYGDADFGVSATASSGLAVSFGVSGNCSISGSTVHITGAGSCTVTASQAGNSTYNAAPSVPRLFNIAKANQTINFGALGNKTYGDADFAVSASATSGLGVSFGASGNCTVNGSTIHITGAGSCTMTASQAGDSNYNAASNVPQTFTIAKASQTITFGGLASKTFGDADFTVSASATSGLGVSFGASGNCSVSNNTVHITGGGSCTITASQAGDSNYNAASNVPQTFTIAKANQTITFGVLANKTYGDGDFAVSASATSGLAVSFGASGNCTVNSSTVHITGGGSCTITASQAGDSNYNAATNVPRTFTIAKANQTITFGGLANKTFGDADFTVSASATSGLAVSFGASGNCGVSSSTVHISGGGSCTITASQSGDSNYNAASNVLQTFSIAKAASSVAVSASPNPSDLNQSVTFVATVSSSAGTPTGNVQFKDNGANFGTPVSLNASGIAQFTSSALSVGTHTMTADYSGSGNLLTSTGTLLNGQVVKAQPTLSIADVSLLEGNSGTTSMVFTVTLSAASSLNITAGFATANASATAPSDYIATSGTVSFNPGITTRTITVNINGDTDFEPDETFTLTLSNPVNATLSRSVAIGTILNDDAPQGGFVSFQSSSSNTTESSGSTTVNVVRTGDTTMPVTVSYATNADAGVPCSTFNGVASPKCDFTAALGTLSFGIGETIKPVTILISQDSFVEGPETITLTLSSPTGGAALGTPSTMTVTIIDDVLEPPTNIIDDPNTFVRMHYHDFLNREGDQSGIDFWTGQMSNCGSPDLLVCRVNVSGAFFLSIEFQQTGYLVERMYKTGYGDATGTSTIGGSHQIFVPVVRANEFLADTQRVGRGVVVGQTGWETVLENNKQAYALEFVQTSRFITAFPTTMTPAQFVDKLNTNAGGVLSVSERQNVINLFGNSVNTANVTARAQALRLVAEDPDLQSAEFNRAFVLAQYIGYLRRNPNDAPDSDYTGYDFWYQKLNQFNGDYVAAEMVKAFIASDEYRHRFGQ
jgi:hypothetical protein